MSKTQHRISAQRVQLSQTLCAKLKTFGNQSVPNPDDVIRLCFENFNRLPTSKSGCRSDKVSRLRYVWSKLNVDFVSLIETQINRSFLRNKDYLHKSMRHNQLAISALSNNKNEFIGRRQQGGPMLAVKV